MIKLEIARSLEQAIVRAQEEGLVPRVALPEVVIERPQNPEHGDYAATVAMKLARAAKMNPFTIAEAITRVMPPIDGVEKVSVLRPGFINFTLGNGWLAGQVDEILSQGDRYGDSNLGQSARLQLEFVSVNPTGPLHVGHGRGAVLGSTLANVLARSGYSLQKEYYVNDAGNQIENFYASLYARFCQSVLGRPAEMPADGYQGAYMIDLARELEAEKAQVEKLPEAEGKKYLGRIGLRRMLGQIRADLDLLGVEFDLWFSEQKELHDTGRVSKAIERLKRDGHVEEREGALWFISTGLGEDKDNVLIRSNGTPTYFAADIAYHYNKFAERAFDRVVDIWGADHQGHVSRVKAAVGALGIPPEKLDIIISQMVSLRRGDEVVKVSKRTGELITLREVIEEVGPDVCRFVFLSRSATSQMDFDLELAKKQSMDNPVYYVQYGHARIAGVMRLAMERGIDFSKGNVSLLTEGAEIDLIKQLVLFPEILELAAKNLEPHHLPHYALELGTAFHNFYEKCRIVTEDRELTSARLKLVEATRIVFAKTLSLMGMNAPERM
ncbi:MAG: arginine--tRNA ligase [Chloroflexi bacterium]|nr:arginine--tRNA ligase [Chloroflexota bacterium]